MKTLPFIPNEVGWGAAGGVHKTPQTTAPRPTAFGISGRAFNHLIMCMVLHSPIHSSCAWSPFLLPPIPCDKWESNRLPPTCFRYNVVSEKFVSETELVLCGAVPQPSRDATSCKPKVLYGAHAKAEACKSRGWECPVPLDQSQ